MCHGSVRQPASFVVPRGWLGHRETDIIIYLHHSHSSSDGMVQVYRSTSRKTLAELRPVCCVCLLTDDTTIYESALLAPTVLSSAPSTRLGDFENGSGSALGSPWNVAARKLAAKRHLSQLVGAHCVPTLPPSCPHRRAVAIRKALPCFSSPISHL